VAESRAIEIVSSLSPGAQVFGDADLLATAIRNLVGNAIHYSDPGTRVAVSVRSEEGLVEIAVSDQGHGIHKSEQARIFERFYRIDAARSRDTGGTGLGLAIVKHICANHGGEVTVWSEEGHGSTFTMRLPAAPTSDDEAPVIPAGLSELPGLPGTGHRSREVT
jgi:two-component system sensor histidine kinase SenX3